MDLIKLVNECAGAHSAREIWTDFLTMYACAISNAVDEVHFEKREALYMKTIQKYSSKEQEKLVQFCGMIIAGLNQNPGHDLLGKAYMELGFGISQMGQFFTPPEVSAVMSRIAAGNILEVVEKKGYATISDPACGAGATLLNALSEVADTLAGKYNWQDHILVTGQDVDWTAGIMCYIQLSLMGAAGYIKIGDTFTDPMSRDDSLDSYWFTPMYCSEIWTFRKLFAGRDLL